MKKIQWKLLFPGNLKKEIYTYGFDLSFKKYFMGLMGAFLISVAAGKLYLLEYKYIIAIVVVFWLCLPSMTLFYYKERYEKKRLNDTEKYIRNVLNGFEKSHGKIKAALNDTIKIFEDGTNMKQCIQSAIDYIEQGKYEKNLYKEALQKIETQYNCENLIEANNFMIKVESDGGEFEKTVQLLQKNLKNWYNNINVLQKKKQQQFNLICCSVVVTTVFSLGMLFIVNWKFPDNMNFSAAPLSQISATLLIIAQILIMKNSRKKLTKNWLEKTTNRSDKAIIDNFEYLIHFDNKKERVKSLLYAAPFLIGAAPLFVFNHKMASAICAIIGCLMLFQHKLNYKLSYLMAEKELKIAFPNWIIEMSLLLQKNNVQLAIIKSRENAAAILQPQMDKLIKKLKSEPGKIETYTSFFRMFGNPEIEQAMEILYGISELGNAEKEKELECLLESNYEMKKISEEIVNENILGEMSSRFWLPICAVSVKFIVDFYLMLVAGFASFAM